MLSHAPDTNLRILRHVRIWLWSNAKFRFFVKIPKVSPEKISFSFTSKLNITSEYKCTLRFKYITLGRKFSRGDKIPFPENCEFVTAMEEKGERSGKNTLWFVHFSLP